MEDVKRQQYIDASEHAQEALQLVLAGQIEQADGMLFKVHNTLKSLSGDLPIVNYIESDGDFEDNGSDGGENSHNQSFMTRSIYEARAWGWLEIASGVLKLAQDRPGGSMMYFTRAWRIWRPWNNSKANEAERREALRERIRTRLWLGEAWARFMSDRARRSAQALLRTALVEARELEADDVLQITIEQQELLPPASIGTPAYNPQRRSIPYICTLDPLQTKPFRPARQFTGN